MSVSKSQIESALRDKATRVFYLNGKYHRVTHLVKSQNLLYAWCFKCEEEHTYLISEVNARGEFCYTRSQLGSLLNYTARALHTKLRKLGNPWGEKVHWKRGTSKDVDLNYVWLFTESEVRDMQEAFADMPGHGRPRKDGKITNNKTANYIELEEKMRKKPTFYVRGADGEFVSIWRKGRL